MMQAMETREIELKNRDGKRMPSTLMIPAGDKKGTVILLHGIGGWKDQPILKSVAEAFTQDGYITFRFNASDSVVGPDGDFFHSTTTQYLADVEDVIAHVRAKEGFVEPLILVGHSMGGFAAAWYAAHHPGEVTRLVLLAPGVSWKMMWYGQLPYELIWIVRGQQKMLGINGTKYTLGPQWILDWHKYDGYAYAPKIPIPTLVISAGKDQTVGRPRQHRAYTRKFPNAEHSTINWARHNFYGHESEVVATIRQWLTSS
jgi:pimeloyl-ACP methyl ester carboxylesterase